MKVYGQLEKAGLEQLTSDPSPAWPGREYINISTPTKSVPRIYNGSNWLNLNTAQATALISQNSGYACTVDWSTGLNQQVILTGPAVISFANPQAGQVHVLTVTQGATSGMSNYYRFTLNMIDQDSRGGWYQPLGLPKVNETFVYTWFYSAGVKPGYATAPALAWQPISQPGSSIYGVDISPDAKTLAVAASTTPYNFYYNIYDSGGRPMIGQKNLVTPTTGLGTNFGVCYSPDGNFVFVGGNTSTYLQGFYLDRNTAAGTAIAAPGTPPAGVVNGLSMHSTGMFIGCAHNTTPFFSIYSILGTGGGTITAPVLTRLTPPGTLPSNTGVGIAFSPHGDYVSVSSLSSPFIQTWAFSGYTGNGTTTAGVIGSIVTAPGTLPAASGALSSGNNIAWRPQGDFIAMGMSSSPYLYVVPFNRLTAAYGTPLTINATTSLLSSTITSVTWTPDGQYLIVTQGASPWVNIFDFSAGSIGAPVAFDSTPFSAAMSGCVIAPDGNSAYFSSTGGNVFGMYLPNKVRNYLRLNF